ncbi:MAG: hypothetical protein ACREH6_11955 [Geminicoccaceae bacterium]
MIVGAVVGFVIGWLVRGARMERELLAAAPRQSGFEPALADERDRLRTELHAARGTHAKLEASLAECESVAGARARRVRELEQTDGSNKQRIARLEGELASAKATTERQVPSERPEARPAAPPQSAALMAPLTEEVDGTPPIALVAPEGRLDDLKQIRGIGPGIEKTLHGLGIYHFHQIAQFTPDNVAWVNQRLRFKGRIEREDWIGQAKKLAAGERID